MHVRRQIREAVRTKLTGLPSTNDRVFLSRVYPVADEEMPALLIYMGLNEDIVRLISAKKEEPEWMLNWRLEAFRRWQTMVEPTWAKVHYPKIDFEDLYYYSAPKSTEGPKSLEEVDPEMWDR